MPATYYPILLAFGIALAIGGSILGLSHLVGGHSGGRVKMQPYESGHALLDRSRKRFSILFFLIAIDFVIFDVEAAFLYPWILVLRDGGWPLFGAMMVFVFLILVGLAYVWRKGGLDLTPSRP